MRASLGSWHIAIACSCMRRIGKWVLKKWVEVFFGHCQILQEHMMLTCPYFSGCTCFLIFEENNNEIKIKCRIIE
jgi:hypothetical protein